MVGNAVLELPRFVMTAKRAAFLTFAALFYCSRLQELYKAVRELSHSPMVQWAYNQASEPRVGVFRAGTALWERNNMEEADLEALCLDPEDIARVAEFFECDVDAAFEFVRKIWLPDAATTAERLRHAIAVQDWRAVLYLCDKLREGARCVGARRVMRQATEIERAIKRKRWCWLGERCDKMIASLNTLRSLLSDCTDAPAL